MNEEQIKRNQKWMVALKSGEFSQAKGQLKDGDSYCCLGVACELYRRETSQGDWEENTFRLGGTHEELPPHEIADYFGWNEYKGKYSLEIGDMKPSTIPVLNDEGISFTEIATAFEEQVLQPEIERYEQSTKS